MRPLALVLALSVLTAPALAGGSPYLPEAPPPRVQVLHDRTPIPADQGALFVPALTEAALEPSVLLLDGEEVREIAVGQRVALPPGRYVVLVGSSDPSLSEGSTVEVVAGRTAIAPVRWGALRVEIVDRKLRVHDAPYVLTHVESGREVELPERLQTEQGASTWLLAPGLYRLAQPNGRGEDRPDFLTVHVPAAGVAHLRVFMDRRTGFIQGGGVVGPEQVLPADAEEAPEGIWTGKATVGVQGNLSQTSGLPGFPDQTLASGSLFLDGTGGIWSQRHHLLLDLRAEQGQQYVAMANQSALPLIKANDTLSAGALYSFQLNQGAGLYIRGAGETQLFDTWGIAPEDVELAIRERDGSVSYRQIEAAGRFKLADGLDPLVLRAGAGLQTSLVNRKHLELSLRAGPGYRWYGYGGVLVAEDNPDTPAWEYTRLSSFETYGLEGVLHARAQLTGWAAVESELDLFGAPSELLQPNVEWTTEVDLRLSHVFSVNYLLDVSKIPEVKADPMVRHGVFLRASWSLL